jgi:hypothetical protein
MFALPFVSRAAVEKDPSVLENVPQHGVDAQ